MRFLILIATLSGISARAEEPFDLFIRNAHVVDPRSQSAFDADIGIRAGKIVEIDSPRSTRQKISAKKFIEAKGKWLIPGLHDMHVHPFRGNVSPGEGYDSRYSDPATNEMVGYRLLYSGITAYLNLASPSPFGDAWDSNAKYDVFAFRDRQRRGDFLNPTAYVAGPAWAVPGSHSAMAVLPNIFKKIIVKDASGKPLPEDQVAAAVRSAVNKFIDEAKPDIIKFIYNNHPDLPSDRPEAMPHFVAKTIIETAGGRGVKTIAHHGTWQATKDLANAGISAVTHLPEGTPPPEVVSALKANHTAVVTTISVYDDLGDMKDAKKASDYVENPLLKILTPLPFAITLLDYAKYTLDDKRWADWGALHSQENDQLNAVAGLASGGVTILPGTDAPFTGAVFGYSLHRELEKWQSAGISPWAILRGATWDSSRFLGQNSGAVAVGFDADLVVLRADPLKNISNTQLIDEVIVRGQEVDRDLLQKKMVGSGWALP